MPSNCWKCIHWHFRAYSKLFLKNCPRRSKKKKKINTIGYRICSAKYFWKVWISSILGSMQKNQHTCYTTISCYLFMCEKCFFYIYPTFVTFLITSFIEFNFNSKIIIVCTMENDYKNTSRSGSNIDII